MDISNELVFYEFKEKSRYREFFFQSFQKFFALLILIVFSPILFMIAIAIKLEDPKGSIFYRGKRLGLYGKVFYMFKFRTLREGSEKKIGAKLLNKNSNYVTHVGKILRMTKLDEIPQFINVLLGDMNIIGPRPVRPILAQEYEKYVLNYALRFQVKPGLSGVAQVFGDYYTPPQEKLRYEIKYINDQSLGYDLRLIYLTVESVSAKVFEKIEDQFHIHNRIKIFTLRLQRVANLLLFFLGGLV